MILTSLTPIFGTGDPQVAPNYAPGCIGDVICLLYRDGTWHAGACDGMRPFKSTSSTHKPRSAFCVNDGDKRTYEPQSGERVGVVVAGQCRHGKHLKPKQRTTIAWMVWP